ncbi:hypothetical protein PQR62_07990 [Herbaspirillum lusitanum]|jgi:hypothetical protein|uniref:Uncharacterized protein n=1 Tax=Herbaspirillum lusitanum TaxID=213312 RepID=A0ABW9A8K2_9BURK
MVQISIRDFTMVRAEKIPQHEVNRGSVSLIERTLGEANPQSENGAIGISMSRAMKTWLFVEP